MRQDGLQLYFRIISARCLGDDSGYLTRISHKRCDRKRRKPWQRGILPQLDPPVAPTPKLRAKIEKIIKTENIAFSFEM